MSPLEPTRDAAGLPDAAGASAGEAERFDPLRDGPDLAYEHLHRYVLASRVLEGHRVLDLASGTGYGSSILARSAASLVSLDLERFDLGSPGAGVCGDAQRLPFATGSFDAVVCFEAIEHVPAPAKLVAEARRVLRGPSILMVSTPDREIYSDRAGHENPFHVAEMTRSEFQRLLREQFNHVRMLGQGLWAGSWIAGLAPGKPARGLGERKVTAVAIPEEAPDSRSRKQGARWADPASEELPVPVYLLAACADSDEGRALLKRALPRESILHDSGQWLLGQYDRLTQAWNGELTSFQSELARARAGHEDQSAQIESARSTIVDLEAQLFESRGVIKEITHELARAREHAGDWEGQLEVARSSATLLETELETARAQIRSDRGELAEAKATIDSLESQIIAARESNDRLADQISVARGVHDELESQVSVARTVNVDLETQLDTARNQIDAMSREIEGARSTIRGKDQELLTAQAVVDGKDRELAVAKAVVDGKDRELATAKAVVDGKDRELATAKAVVDEKDREIETARSAIDEKVREIDDGRSMLETQRREIETARSLIEDKDRELAAATKWAEEAKRQLEGQTTMLEAALRKAEKDARRIDEAESGFEEEHRHRISLETSQQRFFARMGGGLSDWIDRLRGPNR